MNPDLQDLLQRALDATQRGALDQSEALCQQAIALAPGAPMPHFLRATNFADAGNYELAEACYTACLNRAPDFAIARFQLGLMQVTGGRPALGQATWELLLTLPDDDCLKLFAQGFMLLLSEQWEPARQAFERGIERNTMNEPLNGDIRGVLERMAAARATAAPADDQAGAEASPSGAHFLLGAYRQQ
jgi:tetratricopeptide (TPR) repeat protein